MKMEAYPCEEGEVLQLLERVNEAGRLAQQVSLRAAAHSQQSPDFASVAHSTSANNKDTFPI